MPTESRLERALVEIDSAQVILKGIRDIDEAYEKSQKAIQALDEAQFEIIESINELRVSL